MRTHLYCCTATVAHVDFFSIKHSSCERERSSVFCRYLQSVRKRNISSRPTCDLNKCVVGAKATETAEPKNAGQKILRLKSECLHRNTCDGHLERQSTVELSDWDWSCFQWLLSPLGASCPHFRVQSPSSGFFPSLFFRHLSLFFLPFLFTPLRYALSPFLSAFFSFSLPSEK